MMRRACCMALLLLAAPAAWAKISESIVSADYRGLIPLSEPFGFASGGQLVFNITDINVAKASESSPPPNLDRMGLFLSSMEADVALEEELAEYQNKCILDELSGNMLPRLSDSAIRKVVDGKADSAAFDYTIEEGGQFYLYFANCDSGDSPVTFHMHVEMFNLQSNGGKDYLSVGETELETVYWVMFVLFTGICGLWWWLVFSARSFAQRIHYLMGLLVITKSLTLMTQALATHFVERTGSADGWNIVFYFFTACRGILFFTVVVLIGTGWSYMKPFLGDREKRILMAVIPLQVFANIAIIVMDEEAPSAANWFTWRDLFHLVDIICCCAILFPIVWSIKNLRETSESDGKAARNLEKLTLFRQFYIMVVVYIYFTRIVVYLVNSTVDYRFLWVSTAAAELATLAFYVWTGILFRPAETNPYLKLQQDAQEIQL